MYIYDLSLLFSWQKSAETDVINHVYYVASGITACAVCRSKS